jgi:hypothetical protein
LQRNGQGTADVKTDIENMIEKYSAGFGHSARDASTTIVKGRNQGHHVVVLTGSTGGLGSYLLASMIQREDVSVLYAFNRPSSGSALSIQRRQKSSFEDRGLDVTLLQSEKLVYVETDTFHDGLGVDKELYQKVCTLFLSLTEQKIKRDVDIHICHCHHSQRLASRLQPRAIVIRASCAGNTESYRPSTVFSV